MYSNNYNTIPYTIEIDWEGGNVWLNLPTLKEKIIITEKDSKSISDSFKLISAKKQGII